jgi:hypothetical protein
MQPSPKRQKVTIEEVEDVDAPSVWHQKSDEGPTHRTAQAMGLGEGFEFIEDFPGEAGTPGKTKRTRFEEIRDAQRSAGEQYWGPFADQDEWELARWLMTANVSQNSRDAFLKLPIVCPHTIPLSFSHIQHEDATTCKVVIP